jgi:oligopeptide transport system substrate-binding protein
VTRRKSRAIGTPVIRSPPIFMALLLAAGSGLLAACSGGAGSANRTADVIVRVADEEMKSLDPQTVSDLASLRVAMDLHEGLTRIGANGEAEPGLADAPNVSPDGLTWTYRLKPGLHFTDGVPITAALFPQIFARLRDPKTASPTLSLFDTIASVTAPGSDNVVVTLRTPFPALPELLAHPAIAALPLHRSDWTEDRPLITSGPYQLTGWMLGDRIRLERNPAWHGGAPGAARIEWRPISDSLTAMRLFQAGGADTLSEFPSARLAMLRRDMPKAVHVAPYRGSYYFAFNTRRPPFNDVRVRRALSLAVERNWIAGPLLGTGTLPAWGIIPPGISGLAPYRPGWADLSREARLVQARALLKAAGYGPQRPLSFDIRFNSDVDHRRISVALATMWAPLGVKAHLLNSEASLHFASLKRGDFALARSGWIGDVSAPENFLAVHRSDGGAINYSGYANPVFDAALDHAMRQPNPVARADAMRRAEAIAMADAPVLPLYFYVSKSLVSPRITGWQANLANIHPSRALKVIGR